METMHCKRKQLFNAHIKPLMKLNSVKNTNFLNRRISSSELITAALGILSLFAAPEADSAVTYWNSVEIQSAPISTSSNYNPADNGNLIIGTENHAEGTHHLVQGFGNTVDGDANLVIGEWNAGEGNFNLMLGTDNAIDPGPSELGIGNILFGTSNTATATQNSMVGGHGSMVFGHNALSLGDHSVAYTVASTVIGSYNAFLPGETDLAARSLWRAGDPLFVVGNGTYGTRRNAFVITKNGKVDIPTGPLTVGGYPVLTTSSGRIGGTYIGLDSLALGVGTTASGQSGTALGYYTNASGPFSTALGYANTSSGGASLAAGQWSKSSGNYSMALGEFCTGEGYASFAAGSWNWAAGTASIGLGVASRAHGSVSAAIGYNCIALVDNGFAIGDHTNAWKQGQTVVGRYSAFPADQPMGNDQRAMPKPVLNPPYTVDDEVFVVGGGYANPSWARWNALTVKASGDVKALGKVEASGAVLTGGVTISGSAPMIVSAPMTVSASSTFTQPIILNAGAIAGDIPMYAESP
ncbi:MAG: hypothetical protein V4726_14185 [Verrucomicrobiota bacterium]